MKKNQSHYEWHISSDDSVPDGSVKCMLHKFPFLESSETSKIIPKSKFLFIFNSYYITYFYLYYTNLLFIYIYIILHNFISIFIIYILRKFEILIFER